MALESWPPDGKKSHLFDQTVDEVENGVNVENEHLKRVIPDNPIDVRLRVM